MREELDRRPLVVVFLGLVIGCAAVHSPLFALYGLPLPFLVVRWPVRGAAVLACLVGFLIYPRLSSEMVVEEDFLDGKVDVVSMPVSVGGRLRAIVDHDDTRYIAYFPSDSGVVLGDTVVLRADVLPLREGQISQRGAVGVLSTISAPKIVDHGSFLWRVGLWVRQSFLEFTNRFSSPTSGPLLDGMCFSMTTDIPDDFRRSMSRTGTSHIVSTSGLHVILTAYAIALLLAKAPVPRWGQLLFLLLLLCVYAGAAGLQPPVVRAVLMLGTFMFAYLARRGADGLSCLAFAGIMSVLWSPENIVDIGFQLSLVAVGSLVLFARPPDQEGFDLREYTLRYATASIVVTLATAPLLAYHFGLIPLMSVPANMLVVPFLGFVISGALFAWMSWLMVPAFGVGLLRIFVEPVTGWIGAVIDRLGSLPFAAVVVPEFSAYWLVPVYLAGLLVWRPYVRAA